VTARQRDAIVISLAGTLASTRSQLKTHSPLKHGPRALPWVVHIHALVHEAVATLHRQKILQQVGLMGSTCVWRKRGVSGTEGLVGWWGSAGVGGWEPPDTVLTTQGTVKPTHPRAWRPW
jgi:hypothetical protein